MSGLLACLWCELGLLGLKDIHFHPGLRVRVKKCRTRSSGDGNHFSEAELYSQYTQSGCTFQLFPLKYSVTENIKQIRSIRFSVIDGYRWSFFKNDRLTYHLLSHVWFLVRPTIQTYRNLRATLIPMKMAFLLSIYKNNCDV